MTPYQKLLKQEGTARRIESMQQSSTIPKNQDIGRRLRKIVACSQSSSQCLLVSTVFSTVSSLRPTSFLMIFTLVSFIFSAISKANSLVGLLKKKKKEDGENRSLTDFHVHVYNCSGVFSYFGSVGGCRESLANHDQVPKRL